MPRKTKLHRLHFEKLDSTNTWAKQHAADWGLDQLFVISADEQTAGRGQFKRQWFSPPRGNLYVTFGFCVPELPEDVGGMTLDLARAAQSTLSDCQVQARIKWPNDLVVQGKKIGGILGEIVEHPLGYAIVLGIGLNVNLPLEECLKIDQPATSVLVETGQIHCTEKLLKGLCMNLPGAPTL